MQPAQVFRFARLRVFRAVTIDDVDDPLDRDRHRSRVRRLGDTGQRLVAFRYGVDSRGPRAEHDGINVFVADVASLVRRAVHLPAIHVTDQPRFLGRQSSGRRRGCQRRSSQLPIGARPALRARQLLEPLMDLGQRRGHRRLPCAIAAGALTRDARLAAGNSVHIGIVNQGCDDPRSRMRTPSPARSAGTAIAYQGALNQRTSPHIYRGEPGERSARRPQRHGKNHQPEGVHAADCMIYRLPVRALAAAHSEESRQMRICSP